MPTTTFYNLPAPKRARLTAAIVDEFARMPFEQVSINQIVQNAGISRGSFYQYFSDKRDMLLYVLDDYRQQMTRHVLCSLQDGDGDLFVLFAGMLDFCIQFGTDPKTYGFCKNLFADAKLGCGFVLAPPEEHLPQEILEALADGVNWQTLRVRTRDDIYEMIEIMALLTKDAMTHIFRDIDRCEEIRRQYLHRLELVRRGFALV